jgi:putative FmdB family regulatory protein
MPIYEYQCQNCQHRFEEIQKFNDAVLLNCPECQQAKLQRLISPGTFHLKGDGWYLTESRTESAKGKETVADKGGD